MTLLETVIVWLGIGIVGCLAKWALYIRADKRARPRDASHNVDQWTEERRRGLVNMQQPAAKGFKHQRHTVLAWRDHPELKHRSQP